MPIQLEKICRTCMADNKTLIPICASEEQAPSNESASVATMLNAFVQYDTSFEEQLPKMICLTCLSEMNQAFAFKQKCERSVSTLLSYIKQMQKPVTDGEGPSQTSNENSIVWSGDEIEIHENDACDQKTTKSQNDQEQELVPNEIPIEHIIYQCANCSQEFALSTDVEHHTCSAQTSKPQYLEAAEQITETLEVPFQSIDDDFFDEKVQKFNCVHCNGTFTSQRSLSLHTNSKKCLQKSFECDICQKVFVQKRYLVKHLGRMHPKSDEKDDDNDAIDEGLEVKKKYECEVCSKKFTMLSSLKDHSRIHTGFRPFLCAECGKRFTQASNLRQHLMRHSRNKPFKCTKCSSSFVSKGELVTHDRTHTKDHPFVCDVCNVGFTTSSSLGKHRRIHTGEKPYGCDLCPLRFTALNTLKNHRRTHTGEKPYQCSVCDKTFSQRSDCVSHLKTHKTNRSVECAQCNSTFRNDKLLRTHMKTCDEVKMDEGEAEMKS